jgi:hypothetical protein
LAKARASRPAGDAAEYVGEPSQRIDVIELGRHDHIPFSVTIWDAAAPAQSLAFLFYGAGIVVLPVIAAYTIGVYWVFRGKADRGYG